jgi:hypothetical protein
MPQEGRVSVVRVVETMRLGKLGEALAHRFGDVRRQQLVGGSDIFGLHGGAQLPGDDVAGKGVEHGRQGEPAPLLDQVEEERAAIVPKSNVPREWADGFARLHPEIQAL